MNSLEKTKAQLEKANAVLDMIQRANDQQNADLKNAQYFGGVFGVCDLYHYHVQRAQINRRIRARLTRYLNILVSEIQLKDEIVRKLNVDELYNPVTTGNR